MSEEVVTVALDIAYILIALAAAGAILFPIIQSISNPKMLVKTGVALVVLLIVFGVSYSISSDEVTARYIEKGVNASSSQIVGGILNMTYALLGLSVLAIIYTEIAKALK